MFENHLGNYVVPNEPPADLRPRNPALPLVGLVKGLCMIRPSRGCQLTSCAAIQSWSEEDNS